MLRASMSGRRYRVQVTGVTVSAAQDLFEILSAADSVTLVHALHIGQTSDVGDAQEEILSILVKRGIGSVTSGSGGSSPTPQPDADGDAAFGGTVEANNTTKMATGTGSIEQVGALAWNVRIPEEKPFLRPFVISPSNRLTFELESAPGDALTVNLTLELEEIGG